MKPAGTASMVMPKRNIRGVFDTLKEAVVSGWAVDIAAPSEPLKLRVLIDNIVADAVTCGQHRDDAGTYNLPNPDAGFTYAIPPRFRDGARHTLRFATIDGMPVTLSASNGRPMPELHFSLTRRGQIHGILDGVVDGLIQGWAVHVDPKTKARTGGVRVLVTMAGQPIAELNADQYRADVAEALKCDVACGFSFSPPSTSRHNRRATFRFYVMPDRTELRGSPIDISFPDHSERERINALIARADNLFSYAYHLRRELKAALPGERYMLGDYVRWAKQVNPGLESRSVARYGALPQGAVLISIICPVYQPRLADFLKMVDSVRGQTYPHWELLLVDDGSGDAALTATMRDLAKADKRVKLLPQAKNAGIAEATNKGLQAAKGKFIAFLDHDDMLVPAALETMRQAQGATKAKLLYSDEDKIDESGTLSEPHFKPDFNYRFLLEINYICHFVMVDAALARAAGPLNKAYDGAQDHDFLLRVVELIPPEEIHHVPECLYHWRKSAGSTSVAGTAKPKAGDAGVKAVAAHLKRRGMKAEITRRGQLTCYRVSWQLQARQKRKGVSILIPFRDHAGLTRACVEAVRAHTEGVEYEIILIDNWSSDTETHAFCTEQANLSATKVVRVEEAFNFSRINNLGAAEASYEFLLFLNNDVLVKDKSWLRTMLNEMLVDDAVGAVGAKLLYPNGTVQHAGVVLGVGGIADHAFRGIPGDAPGYMTHAIANQQISAVTAACMLVRKTAFQAAGGFDEDELAIAFNDVDLCLKLSAAGWKIIFAPDAVAEHHESLSRGDDLDESKVSRFMLENEVMRQRYGRLLVEDPFYSRNFSREGGVYRELQTPQR